MWKDWDGEREKESLSASETTYLNTHRVPPAFLVPPSLSLSLTHTHALSLFLSLPPAPRLRVSGERRSVRHYAFNWDAYVAFSRTAALWITRHSSLTEEKTNGASLLPELGWSPRLLFFCAARSWAMENSLKWSTSASLVCHCFIAKVASKRSLYSTWSHDFRWVVADNNFSRVTHSSFGKRCGVTLRIFQCVWRCRGMMCCRNNSLITRSLVIVYESELSKWC